MEGHLNNNVRPGKMKKCCLCPVTGLTVRKFAYKEQNTSSSLSPSVCKM